MTDLTADLKIHAMLLVINHPFGLSPQDGVLRLLQDSEHDQAQFHNISLVSSILANMMACSGACLWPRGRCEYADLQQTLPGLWTWSCYAGVRMLRRKG